MTTTLAALSPQGLLLATTTTTTSPSSVAGASKKNDTESSSTPSTPRRVAIRSAATGQLQCTVVVAAPVAAATNSSTAIARLLWLTETHLAVSATTTTKSSSTTTSTTTGADTAKNDDCVQVTVFDVTRGVAAYTILYSSSSSSSSSSANATVATPPSNKKSRVHTPKTTTAVPGAFVDWGVHTPHHHKIHSDEEECLLVVLVQPNGSSSSSRHSTTSSSSSSYKKGGKHHHRVLALYEATTGVLRRKIKVGGGVDFGTHTNNNPGAVLAIAASRSTSSSNNRDDNDDDDPLAAVLMPKSRSGGDDEDDAATPGLRIVSLETGAKVGKLSSLLDGGDAAEDDDELSSATLGVVALAMAGPLIGCVTSTSTSGSDSGRRLVLRLFALLEHGSVATGPTIPLISGQDGVTGSVHPTLQIQPMHSSDATTKTRTQYRMLVGYPPTHHHQNQHPPTMMVQVTVNLSEQATKTSMFSVEQTTSIDATQLTASSNSKMTSRDDYFYFLQNPTTTAARQHQGIVALRLRSSLGTNANTTATVRNLDLPRNDVPNDELQVLWDETEAMDVDSDLNVKGDNGAVEEPTKKRKTSSHQASVLGPGQAGGEARGIIDGAGEDRNKKRQKGKATEMDEDEDTDGPTIAERLAQLQKAMDEELSDDEDGDGEKVGQKNSNAAPLSFVPKQATTESLTHLLTQALQSSDNAMLEQALPVRDAVLLRETCRGLDPECAVLLLQALTTRLSAKPARAEQLVPWIAALLQSHRITSLQHLQPLQNLLQERLETFPLLLQLEGRLDRLVSM